MPPAADREWVELVLRRAGAVRRRAVEVTIAKNGSYLGQACSAAEILAALHSGLMDPATDRFVLSPAHYALGLYATLVEVGELPAPLLDTYAEDGSSLPQIGDRDAPGMLFTTGSLAQGLSQAIGLAMGWRIQGAPGTVWVLISDGELQEGQSWEAFMSLGHFGLSNLVVLVDANDSQVDGPPARVMSLEPIPAKLAAFGLDVREVDGHDAAALAGAVADRTDRPRVVVCRTEICHGLPSLRDRPNLHFVRLRPQEVEGVRADLEAG